ncbi:hypothetical protein Tco_1507748 [Tanacetum coccineum]
MAEALAALEATLKKKKEEPKKEKQNINYYVDPYEPPIPFPRRLEQYAEESLVHQTMESLKKIKINRPLLKEIRHTDNYTKQMKELVENKTRIDEEKEIKMNPRCSALFQNHLPPKEQDSGSFILPCSIGNNICDGGDLPINIEKHYWKSNNDGEREKLEWENLSLNDWMRIRYGKVCKMTEERILKDYWRERFGNEEDDLEENLEDSEKCGKDKANTILGVIHEKLNNDWFNNTSEDEDNLEGILDYLKPRSYDGFIDLDEAYNKRRCRLLGMTYEEPTLIIIEKAKVTRYTLVQARPTQRFSLRRNGIRGLLDAFSYGRKVLYRCDQKGYAVTDIITA